MEKMRKVFNDFKNILNYKKITGKSNGKPTLEFNQDDDSYLENRIELIQDNDETKIDDEGLETKEKNDQNFPLNDGTINSKSKTKVSTKEITEEKEDEKDDPKKPLNEQKNDMKKNNENWPKNINEYAKSPNTKAKKYYLVMEYAPKGGLYEYLSKRKYGFSNKVVVTQLKQLLEAVHASHNSGRINYDIKIDNIVLDEKYNLKLVDFGFANTLNSKPNRNGIYTMNYIAPEILEGKDFDGKKTDIYALGITFYVYVTGEFPLRETRHINDEYNKKISEAKTYEMIEEREEKIRLHNNLRYNLEKGLYDDFWRLAPGSEKLTKEFKDLIIKMIAYNPEQRSTTDELLNHPFFNSDTATEKQIANEYKLIEENYYEDSFK